MAFPIGCCTDPRTWQVIRHYLLIEPGVSFRTFLPVIDYEAGNLTKWNFLPRFLFYFIELSIIHWERSILLKMIKLIWHKLLCKLHFKGPIRYPIVQNFFGWKTEPLQIIISLHDPAKYHKISISWSWILYIYFSCTFF